METVCIKTVFKFVMTVANEGCKKWYFLVNVKLNEVGIVNFKEYINSASKRSLEDALFTVVI